eukprot:3654876-Pyramimonas_sp.AAC.1
MEHTLSNYAIISSLPDASVNQPITIVRASSPSGYPGREGPRPPGANVEAALAERDPACAS